MKSIVFPSSRRQFLGGLAAGAAFFTSRGLLAEMLAITPQLTEGPFYPDKMPLDTDNDLIIVNDSITPAVGEITHLTGKILNASGVPIRNAFVEIWQVDNNGVYLNSRDSGHDKRDTNFQGYGRFLTDSQGNYYFRTIKPVPYTGRTPHIHFGVSRNGKRIYTTQLFIKGHPQNDGDGVFQGIRDAKARDTVLVDFKPIADSKIGELAANFDIVMGVTPEDPKDAPIKGGIGKSQMQQGAVEVGLAVARPGVVQEDLAAQEVRVADRRVIVDRVAGRRRRANSANSIQQRLRFAGGQRAPENHQQSKRHEPGIGEHCRIPGSICVMNEARTGAPSGDALLAMLGVGLNVSRCGLWLSAIDDDPAPSPCPLPPREKQ